MAATTPKNKNIMDPMIKPDYLVILILIKYYKKAGPVGVGPISKNKMALF